MDFMLKEVFGKGQKGLEESFGSLGRAVEEEAKENVEKKETLKSG